MCDLHCREHWWVMASEVYLSFQDLNRFNFSWVLTESPREKHVIGFSSALQHWVAFPQIPAARASTSHSPTASGEAFEQRQHAAAAFAAPQARGQTGAPSGVSWVALGWGASWAQNPGPHLQLSLLWALGKFSSETCSWLALKHPVLAE